MVGSCQSGKEMKKKKKLMVTFDHIFRTGFIQDGERQTVLVRSEWEEGRRSWRGK